MLQDDFLLENDFGKILYHKYAKSMPIIDYHCHLEAGEIYENKNYKNLTRIWLSDNGIGDHYKWRLMRANGVAEEYITGQAEDFQKFVEFCKTVEKAIGNPIFEWSHLELKRYFGIDTIICEKNAKEIWEKANSLLQNPEYTPRALLQKLKVKCVATTDDPASTLEYHKLLAKEESNFKVLPTFRPDGIMNISAENFVEYLSSLAKVSQVSIKSFAELKKAISQRVDYFHATGGRLADHGLNTFNFIKTIEAEAGVIFNKALQKIELSTEEVIKYQSYMQLYLMELYTAKNWTMQLHMNVFRNASSKSLKNIGINSGFDSVGDQNSLTAEVLKLFNEAESLGSLPKVILYSLNNNDWLSLATLMGSFQGGVKQKIHFGCAWWFNDTYEGMQQQLTIYASQSLLANFVGMLTDSRSFLSYPRHEYFRRILCNFVGDLVKKGRLPSDENYLGKIIEDICYNNSHEYFGFFK
ncbi:MAG: glucuronate isomerase [Alphaproteobacteria bacterium]|jgi:glucuronate isomerase|nr:glucuronate isomerase [Alphaproteobacteria bacterium]